MILFLIKEAVRSNRRAKLSFLFSLTSNTLGLVLIAVSLLTVRISHSIESFLKNQFEIQVYLTDGLTANEYENINGELGNLRDVESVEFISKEKAAEQFVKETGEDFRKILDYNPLPASFVVKTSVGREINFPVLLKRIQQIKNVDEAVFPNAIYQKMLFYLKNFQKYITILGVVLLIVAFYVIYATIRLIIESRKDEIETMKLVGGSLLTIKFPLLLNGIIIGTLSSGITVSLLYLSGIFIKKYLFFSLPTNYDTILILFLVGPGLVFLSSLLASWKITLKL